MMAVTTRPASLPLELVESERSLTLEQLTGGQPTLVVLLRHLDCPFCEVHLSQIIRRRNEIGRVVVVGFEPARDLATRYTSDLPAEFVLLSDPHRQLYSALGLVRGSIWSVAARPDIALKLAFHRLRGRRLLRAGADVHQLGGDAVLRADGTLAWMHICASSDDRPSVDQLIEAMEGAAAPTLL